MIPCADAGKGAPSQTRTASRTHLARREPDEVPIRHLDGHIGLERCFLPCLEGTDSSVFLPRVSTAASPGPSVGRLRLPHSCLTHLDIQIPPRLIPLFVADVKQVYCLDGAQELLLRRQSRVGVGEDGSNQRHDPRAIKAGHGNGRVSEGGLGDFFDDVGRFRGQSAHGGVE